MEQGAIGTLTEWQNLYPRREIMVLGMGLEGEGEDLRKINVSENMAIESPTDSNGNIAFNKSIPKKDLKESRLEKKRYTKIVILIIVTILIIFMGVNIFVHRFWNPFASHEFIIEYSSQNPSEREAINISERLNYSNILGLPRYNDALGDCPNYIDKIIIDDYIEEYKNTNNNYDKYFKYKASSIHIENSTIRYFIEYESVEISWEDPETGQWRDRVEYEPRYIIEIIEGNETIYRYEREIYEDYDPIIAWNSSGSYVPLNINQNHSFSNMSGFAVEMSLSYGYGCGLLCGWGMYNTQIIILDMDYSPIYVLQLERSCLIS